LDVLQQSLKPLLERSGVAFDQRLNARRRLTRGIGL
jgi:hypothetical protein